MPWGFLFLIDAFAWLISLVAVIAARYDFDPTAVRWWRVAVIALGVILVQLAVGTLLHLYTGRHPQGSFAEVPTLVGTVVITGVAFGALSILFIDPALGLPRSTFLFATPLALLLMAAARYIARLIGHRAMRPADSAEPTLIFGAGYLGATLIRRMLTDRDSPYVPVGLIDDAPGRRKAWIDGIRVLGGRGDITNAAAKTKATTLIIAIGGADSSLLREISDHARSAQLQIKVFPPLEEILEGRSRLKDLRDISIEDLIGRQVVQMDLESVAGYIQGKRVLVTGAGGSIGAEICRQLTKLAPAQLMMLDRDESGLQETQLSVHGNGLLDSDDVILVSIRDRERVLALFEERRPEVVFHAAALKHLPTLERYPYEAWKTNVLGTQNVIDAALSVGVECFVNISTDKAANPTSILGHSKRAAEQLTAWAAGQGEGRYISVRFGNVIGSRGSMFPVFSKLIEGGGPLTVTHPDATRYFMTIPEACHLVLQAGAIGRAAEVLILDMGTPVRILDIAQRMIDMSGRDISIVFTGLRDGEKLHEDLVGDGESDRRPIHPKISHTIVPPVDRADLTFESWIAAATWEAPAAHLPHTPDRMADA